MRRPCVVRSMQDGSVCTCSAGPSRRRQAPTLEGMDAGPGRFQGRMVRGTSMDRCCQTAVITAGAGGALPLPRQQWSRGLPPRRSWNPFRMPLRLCWSRGVWRSSRSRRAPAARVPCSRPWRREARDARAGRDDDRRRTLRRLDAPADQPGPPRRADCGKHRGQLQEELASAHRAALGVDSCGRCALARRRRVDRQTSAPAAAASPGTTPAAGSR